jgi:pyrrolysyl-tRNA synthetase-like protein
VVKKKRYYRKNVEFFKLVEKIKLWPSRSGTLHGIKSMTIKGNIAEIITHCNEKFQINNSRHSRAARSLRNKLFFHSCHTCKIPKWKIEKYAGTYVNQNYGSHL